MYKVAGSRFAHANATLENFQRYSLDQKVYPAIIEHPGAIVSGVLYFDIPENVWLRLDNFEGDMYARMTVEVKFANNITSKAETYVIRPQFQHLLAKPTWDLDEFIRSGKNRFENTFLGFDEIS